MYIDVDKLLVSLKFNSCIKPNSILQSFEINNYFFRYFFNPFQPSNDFRYHVYYNKYEVRFFFKPCGLLDTRKTVVNTKISFLYVFQCLFCYFILSKYNKIKYLIHYE